MVNLRGDKDASEAALGAAAFEGEGEDGKEEAGGEEYGLPGNGVVDYLCLYLCW